MHKTSSKAVEPSKRWDDSWIDHRGSEQVWVDNEESSGSMKQGHLGGGALEETRVLRHLSERILGDVEKTTHVFLSKVMSIETSMDITFDIKVWVVFSTSPKICSLRCRLLYWTSPKTKFSYSGVWVPENRIRTSFPDWQIYIQTESSGIKRIVAAQGKEFPCYTPKNHSRA